jgi:hypothetical protein
MTEEQIAELRATVVAAAAPIGSGVAAIFILLALILAVARGVSPGSDPMPLIVGGRASCWPSSSTSPSSTR